MKSKGDQGETLAVTFLKQKGFQILETNYRASHAEIDIIVQEGEAVVFIEVKTRAYTSYGRPEDFVGIKKQQLISYAANRYMEQKGHEGEIRFDIISIILEDDNLKSIHHFKDAFFPGL